MLKKQLDEKTIGVCLIRTKERLVYLQNAFDSFVSVEHRLILL